MQKGLIGKKIGMTQLFDEVGNVIPVTVIEAGPCPVVQKKTIENDGYEAVQLGFGDVKVTRVNKPEKGHFDKADVAPKKVLREFRLADTSALNVGDIVKVDTFAAGDKVDVIGTSKGKGTAGAIKRWNFHRLKESHGTGPNARHAGSLGACSDPSRVFKARRSSWSRARHHPESRCCQGRRRKQPHRHQGCRPRPQGRNRHSERYSQSVRRSKTCLALKFTALPVKRPEPWS